ncbi:MAG TPA: 4Fe-4S binding protein [Candidatus Methanoperedenaceae archaeon]|nr:4Fe-4S binding protein [Candidatus Methanoperedenaceae archaeon]
MKIHISDQCNACGACIRACPKGPRVYELRDGRLIVIDPSSCLGCTNCVSICPKNAIRLERI